MAVRMRATNKVHLFRRYAPGKGDRVQQRGATLCGQRLTLEIDSDALDRAETLQGPALCQNCRARALQSWATAISLDDEQEDA